ncbi:YkgJ family cysteine cluster protein [Rhizobium sp. RAF56]|uniref:YkgJ family cysteine cluster protein n=1 Tax=Rhizobium sp. RAF56 TaxID=3233062 RepID=UPI003F9742DC
MTTTTKIAAYQAGARDPGTASNFIRSMTRRADPARVPCGGCTGCCRSAYLFADLDAEECGRFPDAVHSDVVGGMVLPKREDGSCTYLIEGKCSIYERRPRACRVYDCRDRLLLGAFDGNDPVMLQALQEWAPFRTPTGEDMDLLSAARAAVQVDGLPETYKEALAKFWAVYRRPKQWRKLMKVAAKFRRRFAAMPVDEVRMLYAELVASATARCKTLGETRRAPAPGSMVRCLKSPVGPRRVAERRS